MLVKVISKLHRKSQTSRIKKGRIFLNFTFVLSHKGIFNLEIIKLRVGWSNYHFNLNLAGTHNIQLF